MTARPGKLHRGARRALRGNYAGGSRRATKGPARRRRAARSELSKLPQPPDTGRELPLGGNRHAGQVSGRDGALV
eukprot:9499183-Pyramimonas_sp.AAC.1